MLNVLNSSLYVKVYNRELKEANLKNVLSDVKKSVATGVMAILLLVNRHSLGGQRKPDRSVDICRTSLVRRSASCPAGQKSASPERSQASIGKSFNGAANETLTHAGAFVSRTALPVVAAAQSQVRQLPSAVVVPFAVVKGLLTSAI